MVEGWTFQRAVIIGTVVLGFGFLVLLLMGFLLMSGKTPLGIMRLCALPLIIISAVFLIVIGYTETQIAPVLSLLGVIAGYLIGKTED